MFKISDLVNKVEPFKFEFDGFAITGWWYKYRTTTPNYAKQLTEDLPAVPENGTEVERFEAGRQRVLAMEAGLHKALADSIQSWDAVGEDDQPIAPAAEIFASLPDAFNNKFAQFLKEQREGIENPTSPNSSSTS